MIVKSVPIKIVVYPRVLEDNSLEFYANGLIPDSLPHFTKHPEIPNRFIPDFCPCQHRGTIEKKLSNCDSCKMTRKVWYCELLKQEVFPMICANCTVENK